MTRPASPTECAAVADDLQRRWARVDDTSFDPYDGLTATHVPAFVRNGMYGRLGLVQLNKRLPVNARGLLGVLPTRNVYTTAHFISAGVRLGGNTSELVAERVRWLLRAQLGGGGWAYPFDVQTKTYHYPMTVPNVVCTSFAAHALLDVAELNGGSETLGAALAAAEFAVRELLVRGPHPFFAYLPGRTELIHNGSLLAASFVARVGVATRRRDLVSTAVSVLAATVGKIAADGSLRYGDNSQLNWIDGHHTGFAIEAMVDIHSAVPETDLESAIAGMAAYYRRHLFTPDARPLPFPGRTDVADTICGAQGIQTFAKLGGEHLSTAQAVAGFMLDKMRDRQGNFVVKRGRMTHSPVPYARWCDAPMALGLAVLADELTRPTL